MNDTLNFSILSRRAGGRNMTEKILVAPSILSGDFAEMGEAVRKLEEWGGDYVHCDVMDGMYVTNITFGMPMIAALRKRTALPLDVHLMITEPERYVEKFVEAGADIVTFHPEASKDPAEVLKTVRAKGVKAGIVFNPDVEIEKYADLFPLCDMITVMTVYAGRGGQSLIPWCIDRIKLVKNIICEKGLDIPVEADGGIGESNANLVKEAGASVLVAGNSVYKSPDPKKTVALLKA